MGSVVGDHADNCRELPAMPEQFHPEAFSLLVKPVGPDCNLHCRYCFYLDKSKMFAGGLHRMDDATLERMIRSYMELPFTTHSFAWQGGEPTLAGIDFFRRAIDIQRACLRPGGRVMNVLQTNATLINDDFARFLAEANFLVGVSIDGSHELHDASRTDSAGAPTYDRVVKGIETLRHHGVAFNALVLVNKANVNAPEAIYRHLRDDLRIMDHQYIECADVEKNGAPFSFAITAREWGDFLCRIFDLWTKHDTRRVSVRLFDTIKSIAIHGSAPACSASANCSGYFVVEHDGGVYPCDFHVTPELRLGDIRENSWNEIAAAKVRAAFASRKWNLASECVKCKWLRFCMGDCPRNRAPWEVYARSLADSPSATDARSRLCDGWKRFYAHAAERLAEIAIQEANPNRVPSRNDPCPCGSGKKYKNCCGRTGFNTASIR